MASCDHVSTASIEAVFLQAIGEHGGEVLDTHNDGRILFARSVLPQVETIVPGDDVKGGVAIRATESEIGLHPYLLRLVCKNGLIRAHTLASRYLENVRSREPEEVAEELREAVAACCASEVFTGDAQRLRELGNYPVTDLLASIMPIFLELSVGRRDRLPQALLELSGIETRGTMYDFLNIVTSLARDIRDPERRWDLEEFAGRILSHPAPWRLTDRSSPRKAAALLHETFTS